MLNENKGFHTQSILVHPHHYQRVFALLKATVVLSTLPAGNGGDAGYRPRVLECYFTL